MTRSGDYYRQAMMPMDYFPVRDLQLGEYLPDVLGYAGGGIDFVIGEPEAVMALRSIQQNERLERAQQQIDQTGDKT